MWHWDSRPQQGCDYVYFLLNWLHAVPDQRVSVLLERLCNYRIKALGEGGRTYDYLQETFYVAGNILLVFISFAWFFINFPEMGVKVYDKVISSIKCKNCLFGWSIEPAREILFCMTFCQRFQEYSGLFTKFYCIFLNVLYAIFQVHINYRRISQMTNQPKGIDFITHTLLLWLDVTWNWWIVGLMQSFSVGILHYSPDRNHAIYRTLLH